MKPQPTNYSLWWALSPYVAVYLPAKEEDCYCESNNLKNQQPKSLLERSLFFLHQDKFAELAPPKEPVLKEWYGTLPSCSPFNHLLRLSKLTGWEGKDTQGRPITPFKLRGMSHELHAFYHLKRDNSRIRLLFRVQIGAPEEVALCLGTRIATEMKNTANNQGFLLLRPNLETYKSDRWGAFIAVHLEDLLNSYALGKQP